MGYLVSSSLAFGQLGIGGQGAPWGAFLALAVSSWCLYSAGMVLNDVFDFDIDQVERPQRPLPSGQIPFAFARMLGFFLLAVGILWGALPGVVYGLGGPFWWRSGAMAVLLAGAVLLYDGFLKKTWLGPISMGLCRFLNVLLGMSVAAGATNGLLAGVGFDAVHLLPAAGIGIYIVGVTWFARQEVGVSGRPGLILGGAVMALGVAIMFSTVYFIPVPNFKPSVYGLLLVLLSISIARRALVAIANPIGQNVQVTIKHAIFSLVVFDAAISVLVAPWYFAVAIICLLFPMLWLGRWIYST